MLLFLSYPLSHQWSLDLVQALQETGQNSRFNIQYNIVDLDAMRTREPEDWQGKFNREAEWLKNHQYDLVIAIDTDAVELVQNNAAALPREIPVILADCSDELPVFGPDRANFTGVFWGLDIRKTIDTGRRLMPETAAVYILTDSTPAGERSRQYWQKELSDYTGIQVTFLSGIEYSTPQIIEKIRNAPVPGFAILTPWRSLYQNDYQTLPAFGCDLERNLKRPFFACTDNLFGSGLVGGYMTVARELGSQVGKQMLTILATPGAALPPPERCGTTPVFDYAMLRQYNLSPGVLPHNAILRNRPLSLWDTYGAEIRLVLIGLLFLFGGGICYVYATRRNLRRYRQLVAEHQHNLQVLRENMQLWDTAINSLPICFFIKDASRDFQYLETNQPWRDFLNRAPEEIHDKTDYAVFPHEIAENIRQGDQKLMRTNTLEESTLEIPGPDGEVHYLRVLRQPFTTISCRRLLLGAAIDITEMEQTKQRLEEAMHAAEAGNQAKNFFIASVSHEIRTPLNAVIGFTELLHNSEVDRATQKEYLSAIGYSGKALLELLNDVLDLSKLESDSIGPEPEATEFGPFCAAITRLFLPTASRKGVECRLQVNAVPVIHVDPLRLRQILFNLLGNAVKVTGPGKIVMLAGEFIRGENSRGTLVITVTDHGPTLSADAVSHLFEPFWKSAARGAAKVIEAPSSDTGLGLAIAARMTEKLGGAISVQPDPDGGNCFRLEFRDVLYEKPELPTPAPATIAAERGDDYAVLLVDDVLMNLKVLEAMLKKLEVRTVTATTGEEALVLFRQQHFDMVFTDLWMPGMNGAQLAMNIRELGGDTPVPLVAITADTESHNNFDMTLFAATLAKPVTLQQLEKLLPKRRLRTE